MTRWQVDDYEPPEDRDLGILPLFAGETAHARRTDPSTSHEAAASVTNLTEKQEDVLECLRLHGPACDVEWMVKYIEEAEAGTGWVRQSVSGLRTRRSELAEKGKVESVGVKVIGHRKHLIWKAVG